MADEKWLKLLLLPSSKQKQWKGLSQENVMKNKKKKNDPGQTVQKLVH